MAGKRPRSSNSGGGGGIRRKRPRDLRKQTLVRVAEHKQATANKLQRRLEKAETRELNRTRAALGIHGNAVAERGTQHAVVDDDDAGDPRKVRYLEKCARGYGALVGGLANPLFDHAEGNRNVQHAQGDGTDARKEGNKRSKTRKEEKRASVATPTNTSGDDSKHKPGLSIEKENFAAAVREKAHFEGEQLPSVESGREKLTLLGTFPGVGRVSAATTPERRAAFETSLKACFPGITERSLGLQPSVHAKWVGAHPDQEPLQQLERAFVSTLREYYDIFLCRRLTVKQGDDVRELYVAHCVSHILRARARVLRNDAAVKKDPEALDKAKDQGFSRARVLILLPMKNVAYEIVKTLTTLAVEPGPNVQNSERFETEFAPTSDDDEEEEDEGTSDIANGIRKRRRKPADYRRIFRGNVEDDFKLGISFAKKSVRLYADFHMSDIIIASPLGLRRAIAEKASGKTAHERLSKKKDEDGDTEWKTGIGAGRQERKQDEADDGFLSSVEICVVDGAHVFSMQNWDTLRKAMGMMNKMPANTRETDFSRVRSWCLDGLMQRFRQTVVLSQYRKSDILSEVRQCSNYAGRVQLLEPPSELGSMADVVVSMRQTFFKVPGVDSPSSSTEKRFSFFFAHTFPILRCLLDAQILLVVPDYFDYVRVRNKLVSVADEDANFRFASMCEYSKGSDISRARAKLHDRTVGLVLMTERFHFFWRHWLRGGDTVVWYSLPENAEYYAEIVNMTGEEADKGRQVQAFALYDELDTFRLERVVGRKRCKKMTAKESRSTYLFV